MSDTQAPVGTEILKALQAATRGLLFPSESDRPITAFLWNAPKESAANSTKPVEAAHLTTYTGLSTDASINSLTLADLFAPATADQTWFGATEKATAQRFRDLQSLLGTLAGVTAFRVTQSDPRAAIQVFVAGNTGDGHLAGIMTELVET